MNCFDRGLPRIRFLADAGVRVCLLIQLIAVAVPIGAGEPMRLTHDGKRKISPYYLPDGESVAYSVHEVPNQVIIRRLNLRDGTHEPLFPDDPAHQFDGACSPNGRFHVYCRSASSRQLILVIQDHQQNKKEITFLPPGSSRSTIRSLAFTPGGDRIVFALAGDRGLQIASLSVKGNDLRYLTDSEGTNYWPAVSPDGRHIAFSSSRSETFDIYVMDADGNDVHRLTNSPARDIRPAWSPDGEQIAFTSARDGNYEIYVVNADGTNIRRATSHPEHDDFPVWQPDGRRILTVAERDGQSDLYLIDVP